MNKNDLRKNKKLVGNDVVIQLLFKYLPISLPPPSKKKKNLAKEMDKNNPNIKYTPVKGTSSQMPSMKLVQS